MHTVMRKILCALMLVFSASVVAQATVTNCTGTGPAPNTCHAITDNAPATGVQPVSCKLYVGTTVVATAPISGVAGALNCNVAMPPAQFQSGTYTITMGWLSVDGFEAKSNALTFQSSAGAPPAPTNLHLTNP